MVNRIVPSSAVSQVITNPEPLSKVSKVAIIALGLLALALVVTVIKRRYDRIDPASNNQQKPLEFPPEIKELLGKIEQNKRYSIREGSDLVGNPIRAIFYREIQPPCELKTLEIYYRDSKWYINSKPLSQDSDDLKLLSRLIAGTDPYYILTSRVPFPDQIVDLFGRDTIFQLPVILNLSGSRADKNASATKRMTLGAVFASQMAKCTTPISLGIDDLDLPVLIVRFIQKEAPFAQNQTFVYCREENGHQEWYIDEEKLSEQGAKLEFLTQILNSTHPALQLDSSTNL